MESSWQEVYNSEAYSDIVDEWGHVHNINIKQTFIDKYRGQENLVYIYIQISCDDKIVIVQDATVTASSS